MAIFHVFLYVYQRVTPIFDDEFFMFHPRKTRLQEYGPGAGICGFFEETLAAVGEKRIEKADLNGNNGNIWGYFPSK